MAEAISELGLSICIRLCGRGREVASFKSLVEILQCRRAMNTMLRNDRMDEEFDKLDTWPLDPRDTGWPSAASSKGSPYLLPAQQTFLLHLARTLAHVWGRPPPILRNLWKKNKINKEKHTQKKNRKKKIYRQLKTKPEIFPKWPVMRWISRHFTPLSGWERSSRKMEQA